MSVYIPGRERGVQPRSATRVLRSGCRVSLFGSFFDEPDGRTNPRDESV